MKKLLLFILSFSLITPTRPIPLTTKNIAIGGTATAAVLGAAALIARGQIKGAERNAKRKPTKQNQTRVKALKTAAKALGFSALGVFLLGGLGALGQRHRLQAKDAEGNTILLRAAKKGDLKAVQRLVRQGADIRATNPANVNVQHLLLQNAQVPFYDIQNLDPENFAATISNGKLVEAAIAANNPGRARALLSDDPNITGLGDDGRDPSALIHALRQYKNATNRLLENQWLAVANVLAIRMPVEVYGQEITDPANAMQTTNAVLEILHSGNEKLINLFLRHVRSARLTDTQKAQVLLAAPTESFVKALAITLNNCHNKSLHTQQWFLLALRNAIGFGNQGNDPENIERVRWLLDAMPANEIAHAVWPELLLRYGKWATLAYAIQNGAQPTRYSNSIALGRNENLDALAQAAASDAAPLRDDKKEAFELLAPHYIAEFLLAGDTVHLDMWLNGMQKQQIRCDFDEKPLFAAMLKLGSNPQETENHQEPLKLLLSHLNGPEDTEKLAWKLSPATRASVINATVAAKNIPFLRYLLSPQLTRSLSAQGYFLQMAFNEAVKLPNDTSIVDWIFEQPAFDSTASHFSKDSTPIMVAISALNTHAVAKILEKARADAEKNTALWRLNTQGIPSIIAQALHTATGADAKAYAAMLTLLANAPEISTLPEEALRATIRLAFHSGAAAYLVPEVSAELLNSTCMTYQTAPGTSIACTPFEWTMRSLFAVKPAEDASFFRSAPMPIGKTARDASSSRYHAEMEKLRAILMSLLSNPKVSIDIAGAPPFVWMFPAIQEQLSRLSPYLAEMVGEEDLKTLGMILDKLAHTRGEEYVKQGLCLLPSGADMNALTLAQKSRASCHRIDISERYDITGVLYRVFDGVVTLFEKYAPDAAI